MKRLLLLSLLLLAGSIAGLGQSGRRISAPPTPVSTPAAAEDPDQYSESKPRPGRRAQYPERFPGIGSGTAKASPTPITLSTTPDDGDIVRVETNLITIPVSVFDRNGLYIPGLRQTDFKIFENGVEQEIAYFGTTDKPFTVALLIDTSLSTDNKIEDIQQAAMAFVAQLEPQDSVIVIEFNSSVNVLTQATNDREKINKAIRKADWGNGTSLYNAVDEALRKQLGKITGRKAVVLFTDGVDTTSRKNSYDSTLNFAEEADSLVFPIYYNTFYENQRRSSGTFPDIFGGSVITRGVTAAEYALGKKYLEELAEITGGRVFRPESTPGGLTRAFEGIAEELRRQYNIGFVPKEEGRPGQRKSIKLRVNRPNLVIRARDSYIVGSTAAAAPTPTPEPTKPKN